MKIGILTFHYPNNYGAILQAYSLVSFLRRHNYDAEIIDYVPSTFSLPKFFSRSKTLRGIIGNILRIPAYKKWKSRNCKLEQFRTDKIVKSTPVSEGVITFSKYDIVITGSDQTFNRDYAFSDVYYQDYPQNLVKKKIAYAPSFGSMNLQSVPSKSTINKLKCFNSLSCREEDGALFLEKYTDKHVPVVLDPVFLTTKEIWYEHTDEKIEYKDYVFIYDLNGKLNLIRIAKELFSNKKIIIYSNDILMPLYARKIKNITFIQDIGIEEFLTLIRYADFILTDSFHGTAFSIIFEKQFFSYIALEKASSRIISLLSLLGLNERVIRYNKLPERKKIDYNDITVRLKNAIAESTNFLIRSIDEP